MEFLYNGEKLEELRIKEVANDIMNYYKKIPYDLALFIARLESPIITSKDDIMIFKRLYNILFILNGKNEYNEVFKDVLKDLFQTFRNIMNNDIYKKSEEFELVGSIYNEIISFIKKERTIFPVISELY